MTEFITISIVSHNQAKLTKKILDDINRFCDHKNTLVILTINIPEEEPFSVKDYLFQLKMISNETPKGFGANHNAAFLHARGDWFCVMNPDISLHSNPFPVLTAEVCKYQAGLIGPAVQTPKGEIEDNARLFPTVLSLFLKFLNINTSSSTYQLGDKTFCSDWIAGMFMLFPSNIYRALKGFDEGFHLYYEDVDICARLWKEGHKVLACPRVVVTHAAQRESRKNLRYAVWHFRSLLRYFIKYLGRLPNTKITN